jgi:single stranded DNA-binding protein
MSARITIDGNLTADPDFGVSNSGTSWAHLRIASHDRVKRNGEWTSTDPEFFNVTLFGEAAEDTANSLMKGDRVTVEGRPELELFDRRDGSTGAAIKVYARTAPQLVLDEDTTGRTGTRSTGPSAPQSNEESNPRIHHTDDATTVVGVGRNATALHRTLKDHGFRWAPATASWNLPAGMDEHTRAARVSDVLSVVRENGRDIPVSHQPAPDANRSPAAAAGAAPSPAPEQVVTDGRSL